MNMPFRYKRLAYTALDVTSLDRSVPFYRDVVGLDFVAREGNVAFFRCTNDHHNIVLQEAPMHGFRRMAFELETPADVAAAYSHFESVGLSPRWLSDEERAALHQGRSFRVREPNAGVEFELFQGAMQMGRLWAPTVAKIMRIGHVVIGTSSFEAARETMLEKFGFRISDYVEDRFAFMRAFPNPFHHTFALGAAPSNHLHHVNFMVTEIDDVGRAFHRLNKHDVKIVFGPGRHPPSGSVFLYFLDPDGITLEYSYGMEEFPEVGAREPRMLEPVPSSLDTWGAIPDPLFAKSGPIVGAP